MSSRCTCKGEIVDFGPSVMRLFLRTEEDPNCLHHNMAQVVIPNNIEPGCD